MPPSWENICDLNNQQCFIMAVFLFPWPVWKLIIMIIRVMFDWRCRKSLSCCFEWVNECGPGYKKVLLKSTPLVRCNQHQSKIKHCERPTFKRRVKITESQSREVCSLCRRSSKVCTSGWRKGNIFNRVFLRANHAIIIKSEIVTFILANVLIQNKIWIMLLLNI